MQFTNRLNLPEAICEAVKNDPYSAGDSDITVTQLIRPTQQVGLQRYHEDDLIEDVSDRIYALMGQAMHVVLERSNVTGIAEKRIYAEIRGWIVGGAFDAIVIAEEKETDLSMPGIHGRDKPTWTLQDYKYMSVWEAIYGLKEEKAQQLNLLHYLLTHTKSEKQTYPPISKLEIIGIFRDWSKPEAARRALSGDKAYPEHQVEKISIDMWTPAQQEKFINERVEAHQHARSLVETKHITNLTACSDDERWMKSTTYALRKEGRKNAIKVEDSMEKIWIYATLKDWVVDGDEQDESGPIRELAKGYSIETRPGENSRCKNYCNVADFCRQYEKLDNG